MKGEKICEQNGYCLTFVSIRLSNGSERGYFVAMNKEIAERFLANENPTLLDFAEEDTISYLGNYRDKDRTKKQAIDYFKKDFFIQRGIPCDTKYRPEAKPRP